MFRLSFLLPVEGAAHSDEHKSHRSGSEEASSKGGSRSLPPALLGDFDVLRFKNRFLEVDLYGLC